MGTAPTATVSARQPQGNAVQPPASPRAGPELPGMFDRYRDYLETALARAVPRAELHPVNAVLRYHLGWSDRDGNPSPTPASQGKALRPTLCMFACDALGGEAPPRRARRRRSGTDPQLLSDPRRHPGRGAGTPPPAHGMGALGNGKGAGGRQRHAVAG